MQVTGNIGRAPEKKTTKAGKVYYQFSLAENTGKDESKQTTWYQVQAFVSEAEGEALNKGQFVTVNGRLLADAYMNKDNQPAVGLTIQTGKVTPVERKPHDPDQQQAPANEAPAARQQAPAAGNFDDDDDIPF